MADFNLESIQRFGIDNASMDIVCSHTGLGVRVGRSMTSLDIAFVRECRRLVAPPYPAKLRVLDVGAGKGRMTRHLAGMFGSCVAIEPYEPFFENLTLLDFSDRVETRKCLLADYAASAPDPFDFVFLGGVFHHLNDEELCRAFVQLKSIVRPDGLVLVKDLGLERHGRAERQIEPAERGGDRLLQRSRRSMKRLAVSSGLNVVRCRRAYPPTRLIKWTGGYQAAVRFLSFVGAHHLPRRKECYFYYLLQPAEASSWPSTLSSQSIL